MNSILNFKSFFKFLSRNKTYTAIELFGLSVSLMFVILIAAYSIQEFSTDRQHPDVDRIYLLGDEGHLMTAYGIGARVQAQFPEVEEISTVTNNVIFAGEEMPVKSGDKLMNATAQFVNENFFRFFAFDLVSGDKDYVLSDRYHTVISETFARKLFGSENPVGKNIQLNDSVSVTVSGVMKDIRHSLVQYSDLVVRTEILRQFRQDMDGNTYNNAICNLAFLKERKGADLPGKAEEIQAFLKTFFWYYEDGIAERTELIPITEAYFSHHEGYMNNKGDKKLVLILLSVGVLILVFAVINYINLAVAQTGFRAKEMATRRLLGSSRLDLFVRLMMESTLLTFVAFLIGLFLAFACEPYAAQLLGTTVGLTDLITPAYIVGCLLLIIAIGFLSGLLPATLISRTKAVDVVKGAFRQKTKMVFSRFFITFQNAITISLIAASIIMVSQVDHMIKAPLGYRTAQIIDMPLSGLSEVVGDYNTLHRKLADEFSSLSCVSRVSLSQGAPFSGSNNNTIQFEGRSIGFQTIECDTVFMSMLGLEVLRDNHLAPGEGYYLTEYSLKEENLPMDATTFTYYRDRKIPIAGVIKDFSYNNVLSERRPFLIREHKTLEEPWNILIEVQGEPFAAYQEVKRVYEGIIGLDFPGQFVDQQIQESFLQQERTSRIVSIFSFVAIVLSFLGLLAMSTYFIQQRSREIGVRKVFGSTNREVLVRLISTFLNYVLIAFVIATPIIWYIMREWLSGYSYRIILSPVYFLLAGLGCLLISFLTVYWQSYRAANANPVNSIKSE